MKRMKKLTAIILAAVMLFGMTITTSAEDEKGTITVNNAIKGQTYTIYKLMDLASYNADQGAYLYTMEDEWKTFFTGGEGKDYVNLDEIPGYVTWNPDKKEAADLETFAKAALAYAKANHITGDKTVNAESKTLTFNGLDLGYYLLDSSAGALCSLDTTDSDATIYEKNGTPTVEKQVKEGNEWGDKNTAQIGDAVEFQTTIKVAAGAQNYVLHDKMSSGLTFNPDSVNVVKRHTTNDDTVAANNMYQVIVSPDDTCTFHVAFTADFCDSLKAGDEIVVSYNATLNKDAEVGESAENSNDTWLKYGDGTDTTHDSTKTTTYQFQIIKTDAGTNDKYNVLNNAEFQLYKEQTGGEPIQFVATDGGYRVATSADTENKTSTITAGKPIIQGLDNITYYLEETKAPAGYNKTSGRTAVDLINGDSIANADSFSGSSTVVYTKNDGDGGIQVINKKGSILPSTGGIGTIIFYVIGTVLVLGAGGALIVLNRRSSRKTGRK